MIVGHFIPAENAHALIFSTRQGPLALCILKAQEVTRIFHDSRLLAYTFVGHNFMFGHLLLQNEMYTDHVTK